MKLGSNERSKRMNNKQLLISVPEMADMLGISTPTAYELANMEGFPSVRIGRRLLVSISGLEDWIAAQAGTGK